MVHDNNNPAKKDPNEDYLYFLKLLGSYMKLEREKAGFKNAGGFAVVIGMAESQYREYERGETDIQLSSLLKIFKGLNKKIEDIFALNILETEIGHVKDPTVGHTLIEAQVRNQVIKSNGSALGNDLTPEDVHRIFKILLFCFKPHKRREILAHLNLANKTSNFLRVFKLLIANNWLAMQYPENPNTPKQRYYTSLEGKKVIQIK